MDYLVFAYGVAGAVAAGTALYSLDRWVVYRTHKLGRMIHHRDEFFNAAQALLSNEDTPEPIVEQLKFMANYIDRPIFGRVLLLLALRGELRKTVSKPSPKSRLLVKAVHQMTPAMMEQFVEATVNGLFAATLSNALVGGVLRRIILYWLTPDTGAAAEKIVAEMSTKSSLCKAPA
jgi:hypothetical protein